MPPCQFSKTAYLMKMHYHGHRERLRERLRSGPAHMADYELLELLLGHVLLRQDTKPLAKELLERFQSVRGVLDASLSELASIKGFGPSLQAFWLLLQEVMARYAEAPLRQREVLSSPSAVAEMARRRLASCRHEENWVAYVDTQNRLVQWEMASRGTIDHAMLQPRDIMERALILKASGFVLVHNHPGGNPGPSRADLQTTSMLKDACKTIGLRFLDHVIVTDGACYSIMQEGLLP